MKPLLLFLASPYTAPDRAGEDANVDRVCAAARVLLGKGHWPFIPHLTQRYDDWHLRAFGEREAPAVYYAWDLAVLERCEGMVFLGSSPGADHELARARQIGLPIWYATEDVPEAW